jgi:hypothetical protein
MDINYFDRIIKEIFKLEKLGVIKIGRCINIDYKKLKLYKSFPDDFKYFLKEVGCVQISKEDRYLQIAIMIEEIEQDDFDFLDSWTENSSLRLDSDKIFIARNVDSAFYAYHLKEIPIKLYEYCYSGRTYYNIFELLDEQVVKPGNEWMNLVEK